MPDVTINELRPDDERPMLFVDGRNLMYRAIFANKQPQRHHTRAYHTKAHHFTVMLRFLSGWISKFKPQSICIFWDAPKETLWRRKLFTEYKERDNNYREDIRDDIAYTADAAVNIFKHMGVWQCLKSGVEADDLIYSACRVLAPTSIIVASNDKDYHQIIFRMQHVRLFNHMNGEFVDVPDHDPTVAKALAGDKSDNIDGYEGIGPVKSANLARDMSARAKFLHENDRNLFLRNLLLVDMSLNPNLFKNDLYVQRVLSSKCEFNKDKIIAEADKHKVSGLVAEYSRAVLPFKLLLTKNNEEE